MFLVRFLPNRSITRKSIIESKRAKRFFATALIGTPAGLILWATGVPAGAIIGSTLGTAGFNVISSGLAYFPKSLMFPLRVMAGIFFGIRLDRESILAMSEIMVPVLILMIGVIIMTCVTSFVVHKITKLDAFTSVLAATPGGLGEMVLLADDLGSDAPKVAVMQIARLITVIITFPAILRFVLGIVM